MMADWLLENLLVFLLIVAMSATWRQLNLSATSYMLLVVFLAIHEWGAHHKYADVPLGEWIKPIFQTNRNHFDRIVHFSFGLLLTWPLCEVFAHLTRLAQRWWPAIIALFANLAFSALYEMLEFAVSQIVAPEIGTEFVGAQGDPWDAEKDMALALIGALVPLVIWIFTKPSASSQSSTPQNSI